MFYALQGTMCTNIGKNLTQFLASLHKTTKSGELLHSPLVAYVRLKTALRSCICREYAGGSVEHTEKSGVLAVFKPHQRGRIASEILRRAEIWISGAKAIKSGDEFTAKTKISAENETACCHRTCFRFTFTISKTLSHKMSISAELCEATIIVFPSDLSRRSSSRISFTPFLSAINIEHQFSGEK